jgi:oxygen tolerance protein BatD
MVKPSGSARPRGRGPWLHSVVSLVLALTAHAEGPPCLTSVEVTPSHAVVGQQVAYIARVLRRPDVGAVSWVQGLNFPSFRAEWLPGLSGHTRLLRQGTPYLVYEERRALFPMRAGRLEIPRASLSCALYAPAGSAARSMVVEVPACKVDVDDPSPSGRPRSWSGLVGPVDVKLTAEPPAVALGDTVRVTLTLTGDGNLWAAPEPFGETPFEGSDGLMAEVFAHTPELAFDPGERLHLRRVFAFELVPRRPGRLVIPSYEFSFFDPTLRRFAVSKTEPIEIAVASQGGEEASRGLDLDGKHSEAASSSAALSVERRGGAVSLFALVGLVLIATGGAAFFLRRLRGLRPAPNAMSQALQDADRARRAGNADAERRALARALRAGLERAVLATAEQSSRARPASGALSADELAERAQGDHALAAAAEILRADERARFAESGEGPDAPRLRAAADALARRQ